MIVNVYYDGTKSLNASGYLPPVFHPLQKFYLIMITLPATFNIHCFRIIRTYLGLLIPAIGIISAPWTNSQAIANWLVGVLFHWIHFSLVMSDGTAVDVSRSHKEILLKKLQPGKA